MAGSDEIRDLLHRMTTRGTRMTWTADIRGRRVPESEGYLVIGGPGPVDAKTALVAVKVPSAT
jgi:hypothetical protein